MAEFTRFGEIPEGVLRQQIIARLQRLTMRESLGFLYLFDEYCPGINKASVQKNLTQTIIQAEADDHWGKGERVAIGLYFDNATYHTLIFHEATHKVLDDIAGRNRTIDYRWEENFCYRVSEAACRTLVLPYNKRIEQVALEFNILVLSGRLTEGHYDRLCQYPEARILGFSL